MNWVTIIHTDEGKKIDLGKYMMYNLWRGKNIFQTIKEFDTVKKNIAHSNGDIISLGKYYWVLTPTSTSLYNAAKEFYRLANLDN